MKQLIRITLCCTLFGGCSSRRAIQVVTRHTTDTLRINRLLYDSLSIYESRTTDFRKGTQPAPESGNGSPGAPPPDTLVIQTVTIEHRYRLLHDTVRIHQTDSLPVVREVEVIREVKQVPWPVRLLAWIGGCGMALLAVRLWRRFR